MRRIKFYTIKLDSDLLRQHINYNNDKQSNVHGRTKHIELHYHFIKDQVIFGTIKVKFYSTKYQVFDRLTDDMEFIHVII